MVFDFYFDGVTVKTSLQRRRSLGLSRIPPPRGGGIRDKPKERRRLSENRQLHFTSQYFGMRDEPKERLRRRLYFKVITTSDKFAYNNDTSGEICKFCFSILKYRLLDYGLRTMDDAHEPLSRNIHLALPNISQLI